MESGTTNKRKAPRWAAGFLGALERVGEVRAAAELAGIDFTTAYARRKSHSDFAEDWAGALERFRAARARQGEEVTPPPSCGWSPSPAGAGEEVRSASASSRSGGEELSRNGRWTAAAEKRFFAALADQANVKRAAREAGFSTSAVYQRRLKRPDFRKQWDAAVETGKARLQMMLMDAAEKSFDPERLDVPEDGPQVSVSEALNILKAREGKERELSGTSGRGWIGEPEWEHQESYEAQCERIMDRLARLGERDRAEKAAQGWSWCEEHQTMVPPGWAKPAQMKVERGGPRVRAQWNCPRCGGGLALTAGGSSA